MDALRNQIVEGKAIERVKEEASFSDVPYDPPQSTTTAVQIALAGTKNEADIPDAKYGDDQRELKQPVDRD